MFINNYILVKNWPSQKIKQKCLTLSYRFKSTIYYKKLSNIKYFSWLFQLNFMTSTNKQHQKRVVNKQNLFGIQSDFNFF